MRKIVVLLALAVLISGCAHHRVPLSQRVEMGMTKADVIEACGNPSQVGAMKSGSGKVIESIIYKQVSRSPYTGAVTYSVGTYIYLEDGKVISIGDSPRTDF